MKGIKNLLKGGAQIIIKIYNTIIWFVFQTIHYGFKNRLEKPKENELITILGNGPSLREDINKIDFGKGQFCVVNYFLDSSLFNSLKPQYYLLADPVFFQSETMIESIVEKVHWEMQLFVPYIIWKKRFKKRTFEWLKIIPYNDYSYQGFKCVKFWLYKKGWSMPTPQNVLVPSLFNAINMGYKEIRLYGADHSWTKSLCVTKDNVVCAIDSHFYDNKVSINPYWKGREGCYYKLYEFFRDLSKTFESYHQIREYAERVGSRIINCTEDSFIDAFDKV